MFTSIPAPAAGQPPPAPFGAYHPATPAAALFSGGVPATTPLGGGPYPAIMEADPGLLTHTVYHPADMGPLAKARLPIVAWANGACNNQGNRFRWFLSEIASYGYLVVAIGPIGPPEVETMRLPPPGASPPPPRDPRTLPPPASHSSQVIDAINWAVAENERPQSRYFHRLDVKNIAVMGQSCGGVQAIEASADPRVTTSVIWNSGLFPEPNAMGGGKAMSKADLALLHAPTAYISGDPQDVAFVNANDDVARLTKIPVFRGWERGVPHVATYREPNGGEFGGVAVAWLQWQTKGDAKAGKMFTGPDCGLCVNPRWVVQRKGIR